MLHGDIIPVTRKSVQFGQPCLNGDIVTLPDTSDNSHPVDKCEVCGKYWYECVTTDCTGNLDVDDKCYFCHLIWHECIKTDCQDKRNKVMESMSEYYDYRRNRCNCESSACEGNHPIGSCDTTVTTKSPIMRYVGHVCSSCAVRITDRGGSIYITW